jgi:glycosyltransferase involved in cell wall biosynthesis
MRILHVFRSPVGGLFRHVRDLARGQAALGHDIGLFCDSSTGGAAGTALLEQTQVHCSLGITQTAISKLPGWGDITCARRVRDHAKKIGADIIHGHGAKGGLYGRLAGRLARIPSIYTPHGGSLHYEWNKIPGPFFLGTEWALGHAGSGFIFVCAFEKKLFEQKIGLAKRPALVVHNGLWPEEFRSPLMTTGATDLLFVGEMRHLKGVDVLLHAMAHLHQNRAVTLTLVGDGEELSDFKALAEELKLGDAVRFVGRQNIATALTMGKLLVLPSRNESFPYVVLETLAAGVPVIASNVGGIGEVLPPSMMVTGNDAVALADKIAYVLDHDLFSKNAALKLAEDAKSRFSASVMAEKITAFYRMIQGVN